MGKTFRNIHLASTNDFEPAKNDKIKGWVEHNGGTFTKEITQDVTHLVASTKAWKRYHPLVREARRHHSIRIVSLDWLEDSLLSASRRPLNTVKYEFEPRKARSSAKRRAARKDREDSHTKKEHSQDGTAGDEGGNSANGKKQESSWKRKSDKQKKRKREDTDDLSLSKDERVEISGRELDAACAEFKKEMGTAGFRPFVDQKGFAYLITLVRRDILKNRLEKHRLKVRYASDLSPTPRFSRRIPREPVRCLQKDSDDKNHTGQHISGRFPGEDTIIGRWGQTGALLSRPIRPPCPVPLYYFPKAYPYSVHPVVASSLPPSLKLSNPDLRVHIPDPWAQGLQLFESESIIDAHTTTKEASITATRVPISSEASLSDLRSKSFACYTIYSRPGHRHVQTLAPPGSTFDFAWDMFCKFFQKRVGVEWKEYQTWRNGRPDVEEVDHGNLGGEDGADDENFFTVVGPLPFQAKAGDKTTEAAESAEGRTREPSVTVLMNMDEHAGHGETDTKAETPEGGWQGLGAEGCHQTAGSRSGEASLCWS